MSVTNIHAHEYPLSKIFSDDFVFTIPHYQRPYAWTTEQAGELIEDLLGFMENSGGAVEDMPPYFMGSIVLIKNETPEASVVDGQQRLTTLTVLLSAIRHLADTEKAQEISTFIYERGNTIKGTKNRYRLTLRQRDADFFQRYVQHEKGMEQLISLNKFASDSAKNIKQNAELFLKRLSALPLETRLRLASFIAMRCFLVVVTTPDLDSAYRIFSVLNDRGLDLSPTDILKAEIIGGLSDSPEEITLNKKWEDAEETLGREAFKDLFSHIRMIFTKAKQQDTLLKEFRAHVPNLNNPQVFINDILIPMAEAFAAIKFTNYSSPKDAQTVNAYLRWLGLIDNSDWVPPAILYLSKYSNAPEKLASFFADLERLAMGMLIVRADVNKRINRYVSLIGEIESNQPDLPSLQLSDAEIAEILGVLNGPIYEMTRVRLPLLLRLDSCLSSGEASYDMSKVSIEHVLPQNPEPGSTWLAVFPDDTERQRMVHMLGNLVLLSRAKNSQAQNFEFERKKKEYFMRKGVSTSALTTQVLAEPEWTRAVIERRQKVLVQALSALWRLERSQQAAA